MVNISSIGDCGVIIQLYSLYIAPVMVNSSSLGCSNVISLPVVVNICTNSRKLFDHNTTQHNRLKLWLCAYLAIPFSTRVFFKKNGTSHCLLLCYCEGANKVAHSPSLELPSFLPACYCFRIGNTLFSLHRAPSGSNEEDK